MPSVVCELTVFLFSMRIVRGGFIAVSCSNMPRQVNLLSCQDVFFCRTYLGHNCSVEEKLELVRKR